MMVATTREELAVIGKRYSSERIANEADRLFKLAQADIETLAIGGYSGKMLEELAGLREQLKKESGSRTMLRGEKKGTVAGEAEAIREARLVLRGGIEAARIRIERRLAPEGETPQQTRETVAALSGRVQELGRGVGKDSALLRARLDGLKGLLAMPELAPEAGEEESRAKFVAGLDKAAARLTELSETKKDLKGGVKDKTVALDEIDGRAYANLRALVQVGRVAFKLAGDPQHAKQYTLQTINRRGPRPAATAAATPASGGDAAVTQ